MSEKEGILRKTASGRWAVYRPGRLAVYRSGRVPVEITSGELFRIEVAGAKELKLTRMEYDQIDRQYYSIDEYPLREGLSAAIGAEGQKFRQSENDPKRVLLLTSCAPSTQLRITKPATREKQMKHGLLGLLLASALALPSWAEDAGKPPIVPDWCAGPSQPARGPLGEHDASREVGTGPQRSQGWPGV